MPRYDGTGPMGMGSMSGWGAGYCGRGVRGNYSRGMAGFYGGGRGFGRGVRCVPAGCGWGVAPAGNSAEALKQDIAYLENEIRMMKEELKAAEGDSE